MRRLSSFDTQFLAAEDGRTHTHVCQLTILEGATADGGRVTMDAIRSVIAERLHPLPLFTMKLKRLPLDLDYPVLVDDPSFDLDDHLWEIAIPAPGGDDELGELVARIASRPLDRGRPLWEVYMVHGLARTGDLARRDEDGHYFIVDRVKDLIIRGGYNIYPREIEEVLLEHPAVATVAVVGAPHATHGEEVAAAVVLKEGATASVAELKQYVRERVAAYKYPRILWITDALPLGATGKILKREIVVPIGETD